MKYNILIVDDEFLARKLMSGYVQTIDNLSLIATCANGAEALSYIQEQRVDIILLDIHMPQLNGIDLAKECKEVPAIIFTTAYTEYAIESYDLGATDYLLKPIALPRFKQAIEKAIERVDQKRAASAGGVTAENGSDEGTSDAGLTQAAPAQVETQQSYIVVKADYKYYKINFEDLLYIEGQHEYVTFHTRTKRITALYSLKSLEEQLPANLFMRIHKSFIISIHEISEIENTSITVAGAKIPIGGTYKDIINQRFLIK